MTPPEGGTNPVTYEWTDARGFNSVMVQVGSFQSAATHEYSTGNWLAGKTCTELTHLTDEDNCWVKVTRYDPSRTLGFLGKWNPFRHGITRKTWVGYDEYKNVAIKKTSNS
jgi:hypothetical protein